HRRRLRGRPPRWRPRGQQPSGARRRPGIGYGALTSLFCRAKLYFVSAQDSVSPHVQDYAKAVDALASRAGGAVSTNDLAARLGLTAGSVSAMVRKLSELGLVEHEPYRGVRLTGDGRRVALEVRRHHRL